MLAARAAGRPGHGVAADRGPGSQDQQALHQVPQLADVPGPSQEMRESALLYSEPKYIRMDEGGLHTLESNGLKMKKGVYY